MDSILLIEDDLEFREQIRDGLETAGYQVIESADGNEGMAKFYEHLPGLVITDIVMDGKDGIGVLLEIQEQAAQVPVIVISGYENYLNDSRKLGATQTLLKPFRMPELLTCIENAARNTKPKHSASPSPEQQTPTNQQSLDLAVRHHNAGDLAKAEGIYQQILQTDPGQPVALHLLGVIPSPPHTGPARSQRR